MEAFLFVDLAPAPRNNSAMYEEIIEANRILEELRIIFIVVPAILIVIGIPGNVLTIIVLQRKTMTDNVIGTYLISMCYFNMVTLIIALPTFFNKATIGVEIPTDNEELCALYRYSSTTLVAITNWHFVLVTAVRLMYFVDRSGKYLHLYNRPFVVIFSMSVVIIIIEIPVVGYWLTFQKNGVSVECHLPGTSFLVHVELAIQTILPGFLLIFINMCIILIHCKKTQQPRVYDHNYRVRNQLIALVTLSSLQFLVTTVPLVILYPNIRTFFEEESLAGKLRAQMLFGIVMLLLYTNYATDFIIYCLFGIKFRRELVKMFKTCGKEPPPKTPHSSMLSVEPADIKMLRMTRMSRASRASRASRHSRVSRSSRRQKHSVSSAHQEAQKDETVPKTRLSTVSSHLDDRDLSPTPVPWFDLSTFGSPVDKTARKSH